MSARVEFLVDYVGPGQWVVSIPYRRLPGHPVSRLDLAKCLRVIADDMERFHPEDTLPVGYLEDDDGPR